MSPPKLLSPKHIASIRQLRFFWLSGEAGAPCVDPEAPFGTNDALRDLAEITGEKDGAILQRLYVEVMNGIEEFAATAQLAPGHYMLPEPIVAHLKQLMDEPDHAGIDEHGGFMFTAEHAKLIPALRWGVYDERGFHFDPIKIGGRLREDEYWLVTGGNMKRPYGDMTSFELDMADILGQPVDKSGREYRISPDLEERLYLLHSQMHVALQVFVRHAHM
jgi:hypothetical protein